MEFSLSGLRVKIQIMSEKKRLIIIDSNSVIHRAYHALPPLTAKSGELVNAVYGFLLVFLKAIKEFKPFYIAACFDVKGPTFRHKKFKSYKAKRPKAPEDLYLQIPIVKEILRAFDIPIFEKEGFEADDIIGTIAFLSPVETIILSGDADALQLVDQKTKVFALRKGVKDTVLYDEQLTKEKFNGIFPSQISDFKALRGDPSDNIPGVRGIGDKTATELILEFGGVESLYKEVEKNSVKAKKLKPRTKELLLKYKEQAFLSFDLARIEKQAPIDFNIEECRWGGYDKEEIKKILENFGFYSLIKRLPENQSPSFGGNLKLW
jgi:DNA polymerase I